MTSMAFSERPPGTLYVNRVGLIGSLLQGEHAEGSREVCEQEGAGKSY